MKKGTFRYSFITFLLLTASLMITACGAKAAIPDDYKYDDLSEYIKLAEYKGIEYSTISGDVTDDEIKEYINEKLAATAETVQVKEGTVKNDSVVNIDFVGSVDGVEFEGGAASGVDLDIANSGYIDGFAEGIIGHEVGETFDLHVTFPENYGKEELNGKPAVFKTTINYLVETKLPDYNDEWVESNSEYKTTAEYEASVKDELSEEKLSTKEASERNEVFRKIVEGSEVVDYPEKELSERMDQIKNAYLDYAKSSGMEFDDFLSSQMGMDAEQFNTLAEETAKETVRQELVLYAIKDLESVETSQKGYDEYLDNMLKESGLTEETFKEQHNGKSIAEYANENSVFTSYLYQEVMNKVMEYSVGK